MFTPGTLFEKLNVNLTAEIHIQLRLYAIVICCWIVTYFLCVEIEKEWKDNLALRREYYFEADHFGQEMNKRDQKHAEKVDYISKRDPWVPNPEERDTVVSIQLYSLLVGNVPPLPQELRDKEYTEQQEIDWQTAAVTTFFDNCVPNQPGFTSSIAAITILPCASSLTKAWKEWNKAASALRRLRCIRSEIGKRLPKHSLLDELGQGRKSREDIMERAKGSRFGESSRNIFTSLASVTVETMSVDNTLLLLADCDDDVDGQLMDALHYGPQQKAYYSREFAQASTSIFGNYFLARKYNKATNEELVELEIEGLKNVEKANTSLKKAQLNTIVKETQDSFGILGRNSLLHKDISINPQNEVHTLKSLTTKSGKAHIAKLLALSNNEIESSIKRNPIESNPINHDEALKMKYYSNGKWMKPVPGKGLLHCLGSNIKKIFCLCPKFLVASREKSTYAIVTFTSR